MYNFEYSLPEINLPIAEYGQQVFDFIAAQAGVSRCFLVLQFAKPRVYMKTRARLSPMLDKAETLETQFHIPSKRIISTMDRGEIWTGELERDHNTMWQSKRESPFYQSCLPIMIDGASFGCIYIESEQDFSWLETEDFKLLMLPFIDTVREFKLANQSIKVNIDSDEGQSDPLSLMMALHDISMEMAALHEENHIIKCAVQGAITRLDIDRLAVFLAEDDMMVGTWGTDEQGHIQNTSYFKSALPDHPMVHKALSKKDYVVVNENAPLYNDIEVIGTGWNAMVSLWDEDAPIGWIACDNLISGKPLAEFQKQILKLFGASLAQALVRTRTESELRELNRNLESKVRERTQELERANEVLKHISNVDGLTNLSNRRYLDESLAKEWPRARRNHKPVSLIMVDVDFFKGYNDHLGHLQGDSALQAVARCLARAAQRSSDLVARYGGEEFALLLPEADLQSAKLVAERCRELVYNAVLPHPSSKVADRITISLGVACAQPDEHVKVEHLILAADKALYQAKESGRNRVVGEATLIGEQP